MGTALPAWLSLTSLLSIVVGKRVPAKGLRLQWKTGVDCQAADAEAPTATHHPPRREVLENETGGRGV